jgi:DNA-directed RNA polymerase omega subunit
MARVFVSDCLKKIPNKNELVVMAAKHARTMPLPKNTSSANWKNRALESLREIEAGKVTQDQIIDNWYNSIRPKSNTVVDDNVD